MKQLFLCMFLITSGVLAQVPANRKVFSGEEVERYWRERQELGDLYKRVATSRFVVVGSVSKREFIVAPGQAPAIDNNYAGKLYTIAVEDTLCQQEDFGVTISTAPHAALKTVQIFVPLKPYVEGIQEKENLTVGERYLLLLVVPDHKQLEYWIDTYGLDAKSVYYRGEELTRGVILLHRASSEKQPAVLDKITQLCRAMRVSDPADKETALNKLTVSSDPVLRKEAQEALNALHTAPR